jgi:hypothetical protein
MMRTNDNGIDRDMTATELEAYEISLTIFSAEAEAQAVEIQIKEAARQALLDKLGITADEAKLLLG